VHFGEWVLVREAVEHFMRLDGHRRLDDAKALRESRASFAEEVEKRQADEDTEVSPEVQRYVRALTRGANDKARRGERHLALLSRMEPIVKDA
jgi:hypothetical protein